jgi:phage tail protein X
MVLAAYTLMVCVTCAAAAYVEFPGSLYSTTHVPAALKVTFPDASVQPLDVELRLIATLSPEVADALAV